jgi:predicted nuclease of restriction endonuclease-like (RecB) superfamily
LPWGQNVELLAVKDPAARLWYAEAVLEHGWSRKVLAVQIDTGLDARQGQALTNFARTLPPESSDLAQQVLKDPYQFDFMTLAEPVRERDVERALIARIRDLLLKLGKGFAFIASQNRLEVGGQEFYIDLLFYYRRLRCLVAVDLKIGPAVGSLLSPVLPDLLGPAVDATTPETPTLSLSTGSGPLTVTVTGTVTPGTSVVIGDDGVPVGTVAVGPSGTFVDTLPTDLQGTGSTGTGTGTVGTISAASPGLPVAIGTVFEWKLPVAGLFGDGGNWLINGQPACVAPNATDIADFATGSATPYSVSGNGAAAEFNIIGDQVTATGQLMAPSKYA